MKHSEMKRLVQIFISFLYSSFLFNLICQVKGEPPINYSIDFEILDYANLDGRLLNGVCCSGYKSSLGHGTCRGGNSTCKAYFNICVEPYNEKTGLRAPSMPNQPVKPIQSAFRNEPNKRSSLLKSIFSRIYSSIKSYTIDSSNSIDKACSIAYWSIQAPQKGNVFPGLKLKASIPSNSIHRNLKLTRDSNLHSLSQRVLVFIEIRNLGNGNKLIARHLQQYNTTIQVTPLVASSKWEVGGSNSPLKAGGTNTTNSIQFKYKWRLTADVSDNFGLNRTCKAGYTGDDCMKPICKESCDSDHGYCDKPGECKCRFGWTGELCSACVPMPGCVHGTCFKPFECRCEPGWNGMFCDKPTCKAGCHSSNGFCETPDECQCRFGYKGENCTECATMPGCQNGDCKKALDCNCFPGWDGRFCNIPICSSGCDAENGWCRNPDECNCKVGWRGVNCTECVAYPDCENGDCVKPWECNCKEGWGGITCSKKLDWCQKNPNPCLNSGECKSIEKIGKSKEYQCICKDGFEGENCEIIKNN